ncbi:family 20 glycosylhydrolase [Actinoallomurus acaciae]|uniref:beta-N-acetylhexosaminidase n=1 Tax=Actinoallomurus acaciae TaxID=502577 RepID=A0ABV5Z0A4_9ACTN
MSSSTTSLVEGRDRPARSASAVALFPGPYVYVGGDECRKDQWRASPAARRRIAGLRDEEELQSRIVRRFADHLASRGRRLIGWDEILEGGAPDDAVIASWREDQGAVVAAKAGHTVVTCPGLRGLPAAGGVRRDGVEHPGTGPGGLPAKDGGPPAPPGGARRGVPPGRRPASLATAAGRARAPGGTWQATLAGWTRNLRERP